jgi:hypothetical protein
MLFSDFHLLYLTLAVLLSSFVDLPAKDRHILEPHRAISFLMCDVLNTSGLENMENSCQNQKS